MGMAFTKQRKNPLPAEKETFCFVLPEALPEVLSKLHESHQCEIPLTEKSHDK